jgi:predicted dinucleotide-binding enzyme
VLFYATDDDAAGRVVAELITTAGFDVVKVGGSMQVAGLRFLAICTPWAA